MSQQQHGYRMQWEAHVRILGCTTTRKGAKMHQNHSDLTRKGSVTLMVTYLVNHFTVSDQFKIAKTGFKSINLILSPLSFL